VRPVSAVRRVLRVGYGIESHAALAFASAGMMQAVVWLALENVRDGREHLSQRGEHPDFSSVLHGSHVATS